MNTPALGLLAASAAIGFAAGAHAATRYVDTTLSGTCAASYDPATRACSGGSATAYASLGAGLAAVAPGDTLMLRGGTYGQLEVQNSGSAAQPIVIEPYNGEAVTINAGSSVALWIIGKSDVTLRNFDVVNSEGFGRLEDSTRITIDGIDFRTAGASGTTGALKFVRSTYSRVTNSSFDEGSDLLLLQDDSDFNVLEGNTFGGAGHSLISIRCASNNVIRDNEFDNPFQKAMELFDCEGVSDAPVRFDDARRNVIERNRFYGTAASGQDNDYNAIQHGGQNTIVRYNAFAGNLGGGVNYQYYSDESEFVYGNRLYNNTFYGNECYAIIGQTGTASQFYDNRVMNNLLYQNTNCSGGGAQVRIEDSSSVILSGNLLATSNPGFVNAAGRDFNLADTSPAIDAGAFATSTVQAGSGTSLIVADAGYFYDGFGIPGESGDVIRLEGGSETAHIVAIDYATNTLTLDHSLSWGAGVGVHVNYAGAAPDEGAFEANVVRPNPPTNLSAD